MLPVLAHLFGFLIQNAWKWAPVSHPCMTLLYTTTRLNSR